MRTENGIYIRYDHPSSDQIVHLVTMALASSPNVLLSSPEEPDDAPMTLLCEKTAPFIWKLNAGFGDASAIVKWLYMGNWCLFIGAVGGNSPFPFEFREVEDSLDELFESCNAYGGLVAFYDNTTIWAYLKCGNQ